MPDSRLIQASERMWNVNSSYHFLSHTHTLNCNLNTFLQVISPPPELTILTAGTQAELCISCVF